MVFFLFCILVDRPTGGAQKSPPALLWLRYLHRMSKNYLHRTLIFLLPKVYFVQVFIQHTVTNNVIKLHSRRHFTGCSIKSTLFLCETALLYCVRFERKCTIIELLLCYAFIVEKCKLWILLVWRFQINRTCKKWISALQKVRWKITFSSPALPHPSNGFRNYIALTRPIEYSLIAFFQMFKLCICTLCLGWWGGCIQWRI